jgi:hypothetical protein
MDRREAAAAAGQWHDGLDERQMVATVMVEDKDGFESEVEIPVVFEVCGTCDGKGKHVNPSIDAHGICEDEWASWSPDEQENYIRGGYDVTCYECLGRRVVPVPDESRLSDRHRAVLEGIKETAAGRLADWRTRRMEEGFTT